jgi:hypothetical protein
MWGVNLQLQLVEKQYTHMIERGKDFMDLILRQDNQWGQMSLLL